MKIYQITLPYACFGIQVKNGVVKKSAPIGKWMIGKKIQFVENWIKNKKGKIEELK